MFAPVPLWERQAKAHRRGRRAVRAARDPALDPGEPGVGAAAMGAAPLADPADTLESESFRYEPIRSERRRSGAPAGLVIAGVAAVAAVGALGWYMNRPSDAGMAELTPGSPGSGEVALAAPPTSPLPTAAAGAPPGAPMGVTPEMAKISPSREPADAATRASGRAAASRGETHDVRRSTSRVRPAPSRSVQDAGVNASATAPMINLPSPPSGATGPTLDMPPEQIDPSLDPTLPANRPSTPAPSTSAPATSPGVGDATTP